MSRTTESRTTLLRSWLFWTAGFLALPLAGFAGSAVIGRVDGPLAALAGGAIAGLIIGAGQTLTSSRRLQARKWIPATAIGMSAGLSLGAAAVNYRTSLADLALMGPSTASFSAPHRRWPCPAMRTGAGSGQRQCHHCGLWDGPSPPSS